MLLHACPDLGEKTELGTNTHGLVGPAINSLPDTRHCGAGLR
jgi:hypothetical protein